MAEEQQEAYHTMTRQIPQNVRELFRMLMAVKRSANEHQRKTANKKQENEQFKELRKRLGLDTSPEMEAQFLKQNDLQRKATLDELSRQINEKKLSSGEKDLDFMMRDGKMLAEPQVLNKAVNLEQVKQVLSEHEMQFHIKDLENGEKELHFFAKDANVCASALDKVMEEISQNPEKVTQQSFEQEIKVSKQKEAEELKAKQAEKQKTQEANKTMENGNTPSVASEPVAETIENPFTGGLDIGE